MIPGTLIKRFRVVVISANQFEAKASTKVISEIRLAGHKFTKKPSNGTLRDWIIGYLNSHEAYCLCVGGT